MSAIPYPLTAERSAKWIINPQQDLIWFIGSNLTGYLSLAILCFAAPMWATLLGVIWLFLINGPHFYATATRTYFDKSQRAKLSRWLWAIIPLTIAPIIVIFLGGPKTLFVLAVTWGTWHVSKQHMGFMMLYKRKNQEKTDLPLDKRFLLTSLMLPMALFILWYLKLDAPFVLVALSLQLVFLAVYLYRQVVKFKSGMEMNWPKLWLMAVVIPLHWLSYFAIALRPEAGILIFTIGTNIGHSLQYHRLTWFHNQNRYQVENAQETFGFAALVSKRAIYFFGVATVLFIASFIASKQLRFGQYQNILLMGVTLTHYLIDTKIWRVREDKELARALNL